jgi:conjugative transposon TraK protein
MFQQLKNIDSAFSHIKLFTLVVVCVSISLAGYAVYFSYTKTEAALHRIYIIKDGKVFTATASLRGENIGSEAKDHVTVFHHFFFSLSPEQNAITATMSRALYLADHSAKEVYDDLLEKGYYNSIISGNVTQELIPDSVSVDVTRYPYYFRFYGKQRIVRSSAIITRSLITEGYLREVARTDNNSHGLLIEKWRTLENVDLQFQKR